MASPGPAPQFLGDPGEGGQLGRQARQGLLGSAFENGPRLGAPVEIRPGEQGRRDAHRRGHDLRLVHPIGRVPEASPVDLDLASAQGGVV